MGEHFDRRTAVLVGLTLAALGGMLCIPPVPQDPSFHDFSDQRTLIGIPHLFNIASNLPFLLVGAAGLAFVASPGANRSFREPWERIPYAILFACVGLVFFGSSYYHGSPATGTLFWDRLPLALIFSTFLGITVTERIHARWGAALLVPLLVVAVGTLVTWRVGEDRGAGDLRFYALLQGLAMVLVPLIVVFFPPRYTRGRDLLLIAALYAVAQACALYDAEIYALGRFVSGHTVKHLLSALAAWRLLAMLRARRTLEAEAPAEAVSPARNLMTAPDA